MNIVSTIKSLLSSIRNESPVDTLFLKQMSDGSMRWAAVYSNNFRDDDHPAEIISAESHRAYVKAVDEGRAKPPSLMVWHEEDLTIGEAEWVAFDEPEPDVVFAVAGGAIYPEAEPLVKSLVDAFGDDLVLSHGFYPLDRDKADPTVVKEHLTEELTFLPRYAAANKLTYPIIYQQSKEATNMIPAYKRDALIKAGVDASLLDAIETGNQAAAKAADGQERDKKEATPSASVEEADVSAASEPAATDAAPVTPEAEQASAPATPPAAAGMEELAGAVLTLVEEVKALKEDVIAIKSEKASSDKQAEKVKEATPPMSLIANAISGLSAIGTKEAAIDGRESLAKSGPEEDVDSSNKETGGLFWKDWSATRPLQ